METLLPFLTHSLQVTHTSLLAPERKHRARALPRRPFPWSQFRCSPSQRSASFRQCIELAVVSYPRQPAANRRRRARLRRPRFCSPKRHPEATNKHTISREGTDVVLIREVYHAFMVRSRLVTIYKTTMGMHVERRSHYIFYSESSVPPTKTNFLKHQDW